MNFVIEMIIESIVRAITYAIIYSITKSIKASIKKSVTKGITDRLEKFLGADGEPDEEKISSLIKVNVHPMDMGQYSVTIDEGVFDLLHMHIITTKDTTHMFKLILQEIKTQKVRAKFKKDNETYEILAMLEEGFANN